MNALRRLQHLSEFWRLSTANCIVLGYRSNCLRLKPGTIQANHRSRPEVINNKTPHIGSLANSRSEVMNLLERSK